MIAPPRARGAPAVKRWRLHCLLLPFVLGTASFVAAPLASARDGCPELTAGKSFLPGHKYYVYINPALRETTKETQIRQALDQWSYNNTHNNGSGVTFDYTTSRHDWPQGAYFIEFHEDGMTDGAGNPLGDPGATFETVRTVGAYLADVRIVFNSNAETDPQRIFYQDGGGPFYNPNQPGYDSVYAKVTRHEIGHGMGLNEPATQVASGSVMNGKIPCANDKCNWLPFFLTDCDNERVREVYAPPPPPPTPVPCDPNEEHYCYFNGGSWNPSSCACDYSGGCDPSGQQEAACYSGGGVWDASACQCTVTGGAVYVPRDRDELRQAFAQIAQDLAQQYVLSYYPSEDPPDGRFRKFTLRVGTRPGLQVRTRKGYYTRKG